MKCDKGKKGGERGRRIRRRKIEYVYRINENNIHLMLPNIYEKNTYVLILLIQYNREGVAICLDKILSKLYINKLI